MKPITTMVALGLIALLAGPAGGFARSGGNDALKQALDAALDDERHALAFYEAVMQKHGQRRPFANIIHAERRHEAALLQQYTRLRLAVPANRWSEHRFDVPETFAEACDVSIVAEIRNATLYEEIERKIKDDQVLAVFENNRRASIERHLLAFRRHGSGWAALPPDALSEAQKEQSRKADAARTELFATLFGELSGALADGSAAGAIDICSTRAPAIAAKTAGTHGVRIGRTSLRLRNQANTPPTWADLALDDRPVKPVFFADRNGRFGAVTPIMLKTSCLQCHGSPEDIAPATQRALTERYPEDRATGFAEGDLRGWCWVEVPEADRDQ